MCNRKENKKQDGKHGVENRGAELNLHQIEGGCWNRDISVYKVALSPPQVNGFINSELSM